MSRRGTDDHSPSSKKDHRSPPDGSRFRKGQSGNPKGRPKGRRREAPYDGVLGQLVVVREAGSERRITAAQAFLLYLTKRGLEGDAAAARAAMRALDEVRDQHIVGQPEDIILAWQSVAPGSINTALEDLRLGKILDLYRDSARILLEPWIIEAALARLGERQLTRAEQESVFSATRTPHKVKWPEWWTERR